ncbi:secondary thiamine-phosphate synthase enzyme YjbQ [Desulfovibrio legallii]|uniref:Secondary thiamine-phosphate synthase enzyme n=1 Tax=Desulfovibrio legallii TaxID=571438 RepID=A0A1G7PXG6_9BACT|nr:secondary thiamine-phosphate synthase enzyme YjbQ [Desulfovibrio legallii]SDF90923.1 secondary thiamine-phosphate synthase enzyme [Desulfovibrio legallii]
MFTLECATHSRCEMRDITAEVRAFVRRMAVERGWRYGALTLFCPHTTCGLTLNEGADPDVRRDMLAFFSRLVPDAGDYRHAEGNSDAHIKTTLHGPSLLLLVEDGELCLGTWQAVYLCEGDGPRRRSLWLQWLPGARE